MRLKLSYTVDEDNVLVESAKLVGMMADDVQAAIELYKNVQDELRGTENSPNIEESLKMLEDFRQRLLGIDTRIAEVVQIVEGYQEFKVQQRLESLMPQDPAAPLEVQAEE